MHFKHKGCCVIIQGTSEAGSPHSVPEGPQLAFPVTLWNLSWNVNSHQPQPDTQIQNKQARQRTESTDKHFCTTSISWRMSLNLAFNVQLTSYGAYLSTPSVSRADPTKAAGQVQANSCAVLWAVTGTHTGSDHRATFYTLICSLEMIFFTTHHQGLTS